MTAHTVTPPFTVTPRRPGEPEADLVGFELTHRAMRSGTRLLADAIRPDLTAERHAAVVWFGTHVLAEIHAHHSKEDDVLWPVIVASTGGQVDLSPLTSDHEALADLLDRADAALARFDTDPSAAVELAAVITEIADELDEHIVDEEATVFPVLREYVSAGDFAKCERIFQKGAKPAHLFFVLPWFVGQCTPAERAELWPKAPLPLRLLLRFAEPRWQRRVQLVSGTR